MKTLFKLALLGVLAAVIVKMVRRQNDDAQSSQADLPTDSPAVGGAPVESWQPDAAEPMRGENLTTESPVTH